MTEEFPYYGILNEPNGATVDAVHTASFDFFRHSGKTGAVKAGTGNSIVCEGVGLENRSVWRSSSAGFGWKYLRLVVSGILPRREMVRLLFLQLLKEDINGLWYSSSPSLAPMALIGSGRVMKLRSSSGASYQTYPIRAE